MQRVVQEVRSSFNTTEDITLYSVQKLDYFAAVLEETMRLYPPVSQQLSRKVPKGGAVVAGKFVPEGVSSLS